MWALCCILVMVLLVMMFHNTSILKLPLETYTKGNHLIREHLLLTQSSERNNSMNKHDLTINLAEQLLNTSEGYSNSSKERDITRIMFNPENQNMHINLRTMHASNTSWVSERLCQVKCPFRVPCEYLDEVDFRIISLTANRAQSLKMSLARVAGLILDGDLMSVEIWIDRLKDGSINAKVESVAKQFQQSWQGGRVCIHHQEQHAFITNQWIYTYRPKENTREIALILEDDIDLSKYAYRWLKTLHQRYHTDKTIMGYTLKSEMLSARSQFSSKWLKGPKEHQFFLYTHMAYWGYSPNPWYWRLFQDWHITVRDNAHFKPYVPGLVETYWYKVFEKKHMEESIANEMYNAYFRHYFHNNTYVVYNNLNAYLGRPDALLATHRAEDGLHFTGQTVNHSHLLLGVWPDHIAHLPKHPWKLNYEGDKIAN